MNLIDGTGNYSPPYDTPPAAFVGNPTPRVGNGSPQGVTYGSPGDTYVDEANQIFWFKTSGQNTNTGWTIVSSGSALAQVTGGTFANPNGNVTPANPTLGAIYYTVSAGNTFTLWQWDMVSTWNVMLSP